ncbi:MULTISPECIES: PTS sugar transporter subunit IIA [unclassified Bacillus (in: firmicutes)]|uniref:PTS sugar transporter subunit IIA n=1 Tax=unclassified Bacillus (in: firmicutes) TaxID=185979 RepID=UPI0006615145|nr:MULTISPECIES: PTS sugar transporter subunit IIA [unclassified Bacillus (in: firmicutes)]CAI9395221.1 PTS system 2-O-alpha-mannosyl-D-glycerate-specific EIIABC component [Bacillus sp. T2.9-1]
MTTKQKIHKDNITLNLVANSKEEVIEKLANLLFNNNYVSNLEIFIKDVIDREQQMTTGIGNNLAIPHGKSGAVEESTVAVARLQQPVEWDSLDGAPVSIVFLLAIKDQDKGDTHLRLLADLSGKLMDDDFVESIKQADSVDALYDVLSFLEK